MPTLIGTSGWQYRDWKGVLYPAGLPQRLWLEHYATRYPTVENNGTFYRLPAAATFADWRSRTPEGFVMAIKASRYLTHIRRLRDPAEPVTRMMSAAAGLGSRLGPVLLQLPPTLPADPGALSACLDELSRFRLPEGGTARVAVEPRHASWWSDQVRDVLSERNVALCWADQLGHPATPLWRTADWGYLRFHQGAARPWPRYGERALRSWAERLAQTWDDDREVYVYFNNDPGGAAVRDADAFAVIVGRLGRSSAPASGLSGFGLVVEHHGVVHDDLVHPRRGGVKNLAAARWTLVCSVHANLAEETRYIGGSTACERQREHRAAVCPPALTCLSGGTVSWRPCPGCSRVGIPAW